LFLFCLGTLFLWMFWPSFNAALASGEAQHRVVINTVLSLSASCIAAFFMSAVTRKNRKFDMVAIQNATLVGHAFITRVAAKAGARGVGCLRTMLRVPRHPTLGHSRLVHNVCSPAPDDTALSGTRRHLPG